jgi:hypothetical protein
VTPLAALARLVLAAFTVRYTVLCAVAPFRRCRRCDRTGRRRARVGPLGCCRPCRGTGRRVRAGRRLVNLLRSTHHDATRADTTPTPGPAAAYRSRRAATTETKGRNAEREHR